MERVEFVRFATGARAAAVVIAAAAGACRSAAPDPGVPAPRWRTPTRSLEVEPAAPVEVALLGSVRGGIRFLPDSAEAPDLGRTVVMLQRRPARTAARGPGASAPEDTVHLASRSPRFEPPFRAIRAGQAVVLVNEGPLAHRIFSTEARGSAALELPPGSRSALLTLPPVGPIRFFCSLHPDETFVVFAARADHVALPDARGGFRFPAVPAGRYTLSIWSEAVHGPVREIDVSGTGATKALVWIDPRLIRP